jgi:hypothetical protein
MKCELFAFGALEACCSGNCTLLSSVSFAVELYLYLLVLIFFLLCLFLNLFVLLH